MTALIVLTQSTIVTMFGPSKALKGDSSDAVKDASENMRQQQWMVLIIGNIRSIYIYITFIYDIYTYYVCTFCSLCIFWSFMSSIYDPDLTCLIIDCQPGAVCITSLFIGACIQTWVNLPWPLALIASFIYVASYTLLILWGRGAYFMFHLETDITTPGNVHMQLYIH